MKYSDVNNSLTDIEVKKKSKKKSSTTSQPAKSKKSNKASQPATSKKSTATKKASQPTRGKKSSGKSPSKKSRILHRVSLDPLREELQVLVDMANERAQGLIESGKNSRALLEAQRTLATQYTRSQDVLFRSDLKTRPQIYREFARVHEFLNDYTSTVEGAANWETDLNRWTGKWRDDYGEQNFELRKQTFDIYRRVIEVAGGWERAVGLLQGKEKLTGFGSENLINNIYDMLENEAYSVEDVISIALNQIESGKHIYEEMVSRQKLDYDYGIVFDDESATARRAFFSWRFDNRHRKG